MEVALLLLIVMAIISKTAKNTPEIPNSPVVTSPTPTAIASSASPKATPSPTATPTVTSPTPTSIASSASPKVTPSPTATPTPLSVEELLAQALVLNRNNQPQEALAKVEEAIDLGPQNADAWAAKGLLLRSMSRENEAIAAFSKSMELRPNERPILPIQRELPSKKGDKKKK